MMNTAQGNTQDMEATAANQYNVFETSLCFRHERIAKKQANLGENEIKVFDLTSVFQSTWLRTQSSEALKHFYTESRAAKFRSTSCTFE
jgi:hypothetical protein